LTPSLRGAGHDDRSHLSVTLHSPLPPLMTDETPDADKVRIRRQPPVPVTLAVFLASIAGFMVVVAGLFALMRYLGKH
jgi:hypothetical protein